MLVFPSQTRGLLAVGSGSRSCVSSRISSGAPIALWLLIKLPVHARIDENLDESRRIGSQTAPRPYGRDRVLWAARFTFYRSKRSQPDHSENRQRYLRFVDTPRPSRQSVPAATALRSGLVWFHGARRALREVRMTVAGHEVVVDHADRLHEGIDDGRAAELEAASGEFLRDLA
jgi:hypothetical protein